MLQLSYDTYVDAALRERIGARLKGLRAERKLHQAQLADMAGVSTATLQAVEYGQRPVRQASIDAIAHALGTSLASLRAEQDPYHGTTASPPLNHEDLQVAQLFHDASTTTRAEVLNLLKGRQTPAQLQAVRDSQDALVQIVLKTHEQVARLAKVLDGAADDTPPGVVTVTVPHSSLLGTKGRVE